MPETPQASRSDGILELALLALLVGLGPLALLACRPVDSVRPDLYLISVDGLAADRLDCFGGPPGNGRSVCALGTGGTLFAWAVAPGGGEASAAASLLTGRDTRDHGVQDDGTSFLRDEQTTVAESLSLAGYRTAAFVASPRVNRSRRFDQGFDHYDDEAAAQAASADSRANGSADPGIGLSNRVQAWLLDNPSPRFVWIHAGQPQDLDDLDRLLSRLAQTLDPESDRPGVLFVALRGEVFEPGGPIRWRSHRVPLLWRPPAANGAGGWTVSRRLASLLDVPGTLRAAARIESAPSPGSPESPDHKPSEEPGFEPRDLARLARSDGADAPPERFVLLATASERGEVGLASDTHVYVRARSALDGSGQPLPTSELVRHQARFATLPIFDPLRDAAPRSAALEPGLWRLDVLAADSPVPRLEFHLARRLAAPVPDPQAREEIR